MCRNRFDRYRVYISHSDSGKFGTQDSILAYLDFFNSVPLGQQLTGVASIVVDLDGGAYSCYIQVVPAEDSRVIEGTATVLIGLLAELSA